MPLKIDFNERKGGKHISCLTQPKLEEFVQAICVQNGFSYYTGDLTELTIFKYTEAKPTEIEVDATLDAWARFKNLHPSTEIDTVIESMVDIVEKNEHLDTLHIVFDIHGQIIDTNSQSAYGIKRESKQWTWTTYDAEESIITALKYLRENHSMLVFDSDITSQVWFNFRYLLVYPMLIHHMGLMRYTNMEYDFWIELAARFPRLYQVARQFHNWTVDMNTLEALITAYKV